MTCSARRFVWQHKSCQKLASRKSSRKESVVLLLLMWSGMFWGPTWSQRKCVSTRITFSDQHILRFLVEASSSSESLESEDVSLSFWSSHSELEVSTVIKELLHAEDVGSLSGSVVAWSFLFLALLPVG